MKDFNSVFVRPMIAMGKSSLLPTMEVDDEMRLAIYYIMDVYGIGVQSNSHGSWEWLSFHKNENDPPLTGDDITDLHPDVAKYNKHKENFEHGVFPDGYRQRRENTKKAAADFPEKFTGKYGWLSPAGEFVASEWGTHEVSAKKIISEYYGDPDVILDVCDEARDYLVDRGWVLIHSPANDGYIVTHSDTKAFTKKQCEFLYDYFMALGNTSRAYQYM